MIQLRVNLLLLVSFSKFAHYVKFNIFDFALAKINLSTIVKTCIGNKRSFG